MKQLLGWLLLSIPLVLLPLSCGDDPADGQEGGACIDGERCDPGLLCNVVACVREGTLLEGDSCVDGRLCVSGYCDGLRFACQAETSRPDSELLIVVCESAERCEGVDSTREVLQACPGLLDASLDTSEEQTRLANLASASRRTQDCLLTCMGAEVCARFREDKITSLEGMIDADFSEPYDACVPEC